ncbi:MAG: hypothetical protein IPI82_15690 [Candidatus Microthrix sp.]|nr:hypothetical protein [Candidatus Microthrix sp.]MBK7323834.1 hypothetical protein [Candidatus Microthrix sp.]
MVVVGSGDTAGDRGRAVGGRLGDDLRAAFVELGVGGGSDLPAIHSACYEPGAAVFDLALPEPQEYTDTAVKRAGPAFAWHRHVPDVTAA